MSENKEKYEQLNSKPKVIKFGFLEKEGEKFSKSFESRYLVLFSDGELEFYKGVSKPKEEGQISEITGGFKGTLNISFVRFRIVNGYKKKKFVLEIELSDKNLYIAFASDDEMYSWRLAFEGVGCEFYDILVPQTLTPSQLKEREERKKKAQVKRENQKKRTFRKGLC